MGSANTRAALATKHGKELIFQPAFDAIGISVTVAEVDTDQFGTFAGEIERLSSPRQTAERKARAGIKASSCAIGLASEGSFGPHPSAPFFLLDTELVVYVDTELDYAVFESASEISAVPSAVVVEDLDVVGNLKITSFFPEQRAIVIAEDPETKARQIFAKGIDNPGDLRHAIEVALADQPHPVIVEPDLRAHHCPDRRRVIGTAVDRLVQRLQQDCPRCNTAGFGPIRTIPGLECGLCGLPTTRPATDVLGCPRCQLETEVPRGGNADPTFCDRCNP